MLPTDFRCHWPGLKSGPLSFVFCKKAVPVNGLKSVRSFAIVEFCINQACNCARSIFADLDDSSSKGDFSHPNFDDSCSKFDFPTLALKFVNAIRLPSRTRRPSLIMTG